MDQLLTLVQIVLANAVVVAPIVGIVLFLRRGLDLEEGVPIRYAEPGWPTGVQEEDVPRFRVERARSRSAPPTAVPARAGSASRIAQGCELAAAR
jgi:hypothetical protein